MLNEEHYIKNSFMRNGDVDVECKCGEVFAFSGNPSISHIEAVMNEHIRLIEDIKQQELEDNEADNND